jgi:uncharacterized protein YjbJ (UPF0337 family)
MADFSDKAAEVAGRAKQAAGELTGNRDLHAEGTVDKTTAQVRQGVDALADSAKDAVSTVAETASTTAAAVEDAAHDVKDKAHDVTDAVADAAIDVKDKATHTARQFHLDDSRVLVAAGVAAAALTLTLAFRRTRRNKAAVTARGFRLISR